MKLGLVTYNMAKDWDVKTIIANCKATGFEGVELRTTHAHGVDPTLGPAQRAEIKEQFEDSPIKLWGLGSVCEYHAVDPAEVKRNIEVTRDFVKLAKDVGAVGVKVRPNGLQVDKGIPKEKTLEQIGKALIECGKFAADFGIEIWLEVHGKDTCLPQNIHTVMQACGHPSVGVCWNSNKTDIVNGSVKENFNLLKPWIRSSHIVELCDEAYPWAELFGLFKAMNYQGFTLAEIQGSSDPIRVMNYYRALWKKLAK
jgi:sugar phosphate isomerase/epimerase